MMIAPTAANDNWNPGRNSCNGAQIRMMVPATPTALSAAIGRYVNRPSKIAATMIEARTTDG
jgi:hypothetical protein